MTLTLSAPGSGTANGGGGAQASDEAIRHLAKAMVDLANDPDYFVQALTDMIVSMRPALRSTLTEQHRRCLIESGAYTAEELESASSELEQGALQLRAAKSWLSQLLATMSLDEVIGFLGWTEEAVRAAVSEGRLYAVEISGQLRFPDWQFDAASPGRLIPELREVIEVVSARWDWQSVAGFMSTPQSSLVAEGRKTPVEWLRDGVSRP